MVAELRNKNPRIRLAVLTIAGTAITSAWSSVALAGTKVGTALPALVALSPVLLYAAIFAPMLFPFGPYIVAAPLDEILTLTSYGTLERLLGLLSAAAMLLYMLRTKSFTDPSSWLASWILLYLWMGASLLWATDVSRAEEQIATAVQLLAFYITVSMFPISMRRLQQVLYLVIAGGVVASAYAFYLYSTGVSIQSRLAISDVNASGDPNHFAASLLVPLAMTLLLILWHSKIAMKLCMLPVAGLLTGAIILSGSRGAMLGVAALLVFLIVRDPHRKTLAAVAGVGVLAIALAAGPSLAARFMEANVNGGAGRADIWHVGWMAFKQNWLLGAGYQNFADAYDRAYISVFQPFYTSWHRAPHNLLLGTAVELGIVGLALMLVAWYGQYRMLSFIEPSDDRYGLRLMLQGCVLAMFIISMFSDIMQTKYIWLLFFLIALTRNVRKEQPKHA